MCLDDRKGTSSHAATHASPATAPFAGGTRRGGLKRETICAYRVENLVGSENTTTASGNWRSKSAANMIGRHADFGITPDISGADAIYVEPDIGFRSSRRRRLQRWRICFLWGR
jgi:hypothetical protein